MFWAVRGFSRESDAGGSGASGKDEGGVRSGDTRSLNFVILALGFGGYCRQLSPLCLSAATFVFVTLHFVLSIAPFTAVQPRFVDLHRAVLSSKFVSKIVAVFCCSAC